MKIITTSLNGAFIITPERINDERGFFARVFCRRELEKIGLIPDVVQCNISFNLKRGTLRGLHFQKSPYGEVKIIRCTSGAVFDVLVDLRSDSATYLKWFGTTLSHDNRKMIYAPKGFAHGYLTLKDNSEVFYQVSEFYSPDHEAGVRWDDPLFKISWPEPVSLISKKDSSYPDYKINEIV
ncbi:dTDP-4-dehydrorhamnose 3,5-epimerase [Desulfonatronovibrio magnus]|uniref:dTDP-4-dehydrorhamnose 3,5-epimerase n=1 Tax=Desulfonatronovibrio magnus TaxID=698827 RepID=UPI0005EB1499|nr:dTDP-4-dehydrorhamnose 3,5-epimerase [Desulfonatronovibrio magnus]